MPVPSHYPARVRTALESLIERVREDVDSLAVYGSLARGTYRERESDVNLAVVVLEASAAKLHALHDPFRTAFREVRVDPFFVEAGEIARIAEAFPIKLRDIRAHHDPIFGEDRFASIEIDREHLRIRLEQELRNHLLRLRRAAVDHGNDAGELARSVYRSARALELELGTLLELSGEEPPASAAEVAAAAAAKFDLDRATLDAVARFRTGAGEIDVAAAFDGVLAVVGKAVEIADQLEVTR
jgi:predicted nucleotidyltransferase